jgi:hypothetical protein
MTKVIAIGAACYTDGSNCLIGLTRFTSGGKLYLEKAGKPRCFG